MKTLTILTSFLLLSFITQAQSLETDKLNKEAVSQLSFLAGNWKGEGWMMGHDGQKHMFSQTENIRFKNDSTALLIEGLGMDKGKVIHNALAVLTFNPSEKNYNFYSFLANGREGKFKAELLNDKLYWYPMENMRYIISLNEKGQWLETGEMNRGNQWFQFFEMTLTKQNK